MVFYYLATPLHSSSNLKGSQNMEMHVEKNKGRLLRRETKVVLIFRKLSTVRKLSKGLN